MEVMLPVRRLDMDFDFNSARASPCVTAPSTPRGFGDYYISAPASPTHLSQLYCDFDDFLIDDGGDGDGKSAADYGVPFSWEEKPGKPKKGEDVFDFAFDVGEECETGSLSAEELFDGGMIKPLEPPPSGRKKTSKIGAFSPRYKRKSESFAEKGVRRSPERERGRERVSSLQSSSRRATRSVSPLRVSQYPWEEEQEKQQQDSAGGDSKPPSALSSSSSSKGLIKKWRLKDFFLFRSASEGRASDKDHLKKYTAAVVKGSSFRGGNDSSSHSGSLSRRRRRGPISAHELHYTFNRAISEDLKKKTFLPYKQGILGKLAFNPAVHALANGFGLSRK